VKADLARRFPHPTDRGRHSTPVEAIVRLLLVKHLHNGSFQQTEECVAESLVLRWFCRVYLRRVPDDTPLIRWSQLIGPETLEALHERVMQLAVRARVTNGRKLRVDATCVPTTIPHPTESGLWVDSVEAARACGCRLLQRAKPVLAQTRTEAAELCRSHLRSAGRLAPSLHRRLRRKSEEKLEQQREWYQRLLQTTEERLQQAERVRMALRRRSEHLASRLREQTQQVLPLVQRVIAQTRARVLEGQQVASEEKVLSLFEPHTRVIARHKGGADVAFGRLVTL
jgi:IS5 family transposase